MSTELLVILTLANNRSVKNMKIVTTFYWIIKFYSAFLSGRVNDDVQLFLKALPFPF